MRILSMVMLTIFIFSVYFTWIKVHPAPAVGLAVLFFEAVVIRRNIDIVAKAITDTANFIGKIKEAKK